MVGHSTQPGWGTAGDCTPKAATPFSLLCQAFPSSVFHPERLQQRFPIPRGNFSPIARPAAAPTGDSERPRGDLARALRPPRGV